MFTYVARQPIFDRNKRVYAYELLFRDGEKNCFPNVEPDEATSKILTDSHLSFGLEGIVGNKIAFINFHQNSLLRHFPTSLDPKKTVVEIVESVIINKDLIDACKHIRSLGYTLALDDYDFAPHWEKLLDIVSIVKIEVDSLPQNELVEVIKKLKQRDIVLVVERVETTEQFERYKELGCDYFQGYFLARPQMIKHKVLGQSKITMLELLVETLKPELDAAKITSIFEKDAALTFKLLRFLNNSALEKSQSISSLRHAINYMGEFEIKKFIALLAIANLNETQPIELLSMSLVRAKYCELVSEYLGVVDNPPLGYLTGLLSLIDVIVEQDMDTVLDKLPIDNSVKQALLGTPGPLADCLKLVGALETADWQKIETLRCEYSLKQTTVHIAYLESLEWSRSILFVPTTSE